MSATSPADHEDMELGAAWRRATDALPEGWWLYGVRLYTRADFRATAYGPMQPATRGTLHGIGLTPTAALDALTAALRERSV